MATPEIQGTAGAEILRKALIAAVDVSGTTGETDWATAVWEIQGYKIEDSSIELDIDEEDITDILGDTYNTVNSVKSSQTFDPNTLRAGDKLNAIMIDNYRMNATEKTSAFRAIQVWGMLGESDTGPFPADVYIQSTCRPNGIGGSSRVGAPFDLKYGGKCIHGTVDKLTAGFTFTPAV